jgi:hypothetical protein
LTRRLSALWVGGTRDPGADPGTGAEGGVRC